MSSDKKPPAAWLAAKPFINGGLSGMIATSIIQPIDMIKVRIQIGDKGGPVSHRLRLRAPVGSHCHPFPAIANRRLTLTADSPAMHHCPPVRHCLTLTADSPCNAPPPSPPSSDPLIPFPLPLSAGLPQFAVAGNIIKKDGFLALYKGLDAGLLRQATYTTARLGIFNNLSAALKDMNGGQVCG